MNRVMNSNKNWENFDPNRDFRKFWPNAKFTIFFNEIEILKNFERSQDFPKILTKIAIFQKFY